LHNWRHPIEGVRRFYRVDAQGTPKFVNAVATRSAARVQSETGAKQSIRVTRRRVSAQRDHCALRITARLVFQPGKLEAQPGLSVVKADVLDEAALAGSLRGHDAVPRAFSGHASAARVQAPVLLAVA